MRIKILPVLLVIALASTNCKKEIVDVPDRNLSVEEFVEDYSIFANPERGMYIHKQFDTSAAQAIKPGELIPQREILGYSLVLTIYYLGEFMDKPINDQMLNLIEQNMITLRESGLKAILRFAYSQSEQATIYDAPEDITLGHIAQLAPIIQRNIDVIAVFQAGFIGAWGEWWYSSHYGNASTPDYAKRKHIIDALLGIIPNERMISMRTPSHKTKILNITFQDSLTRNEAYNGTEKARLAHHNDCFLADASDMGTYVSTQSRNYTATDSKYTCMGGETCAPSTYAECQKAISAMEKYHWSYLNKDYNRVVLNDWKQKGCFDEVQKRLGYRFVLKSAEHPANFKQDDEYNVKIIFENIGFSAPYNPYILKLLFRDAEGQIVYEHVSKEDPRFWYGGDSIQINGKLELPLLPAGNYDVLLSLTDAQEKISNRPAYSIRFANEDVWEAETGYNLLFSQTIK
jgi:hypothetical protein